MGWRGLGLRLWARCLNEAPHRLLGSLTAQQWPPRARVPRPRPDPSVNLAIQREGMESQPLMEMVRLTERKWPGRGIYVKAVSGQ